MLVQVSTAIGTRTTTLNENDLPKTGSVKWCFRSRSRSRKPPSMTSLMSFSTTSHKAPPPTTRNSPHSPPTRIQTPSVNSKSGQPRTLVLLMSRSERGGYVSKHTRLRMLSSTGAMTSQPNIKLPIRQRLRQRQWPHPPSPTTMTNDDGSSVGVIEVDVRSLTTNDGRRPTNNEQRTTNDE